VADTPTWGSMLQRYKTLVVDLAEESVLVSTGSIVVGVSFGITLDAAANIDTIFAPTPSRGYQTDPRLDSLQGLTAKVWNGLCVCCGYHSQAV